MRLPRRQGWRHWAGNETSWQTADGSQEPRKTSRQPRLFGSRLGTDDSRLETAFETTLIFP